MGAVLNGTNQRFDPGTLLTFASSIPTGVTVSWWGKWTATARIFLCGNLGGTSGGANQQSLWCANNSGYSGGIAAVTNRCMIEIGNNADDGIVYLRDQTLNNGNLHHQAWVVRQTGAGGGANNVVEHWVNGVKNTTFTKTFDGPFTTPFSDFTSNFPIGAYRDGASSYNFYWNGTLVDVRFHNVALSDGELLEIYGTRGCDSVHRGKLLHMPLVEDARDLSMNKISVTPVNSPTYAAAYELDGNRRRAA